MLKPKEKYLDRARRNGSIDRLCKLLSAAHVLNGVSNSLMSEAEDIMKNNNLLLGELKRLNNDFIRAADKFFSCYTNLIEKSNTAYLRDVDELEQKIRAWINAPSDWAEQE